MATRKIQRRVITPVKKVETEVDKVKDDIVEAVSAEENTPSSEAVKPVRTKKVCVFCQNKTNPSYTDLSTLRRFLTDRAKIVSREKSAVCATHQRQIAKNIKYARHLSLLPFVPKV